MGAGSSKSSKKKSNNQSLSQNWELVQTTSSFNILRNKNDQTQAEQYFYTLENRYDPSAEEFIFDKRNQSTLPLVRILDYQLETKGSALVPKNNFRVLTQRLAHRLSACPQFTFDQTLYILNQSLQGFGFLYHSVGPFDITSNMIAFTPKGQVRVWLNENFGLNYPYHEKRTLQATRLNGTKNYNSDYVPFEEIQMVRNIVNIIQDRCEQGLFYEDFRKKIRKNIGFNEAKRFVREQLENPQNVRLERIDLLRNLVRTKIPKYQKQMTGKESTSYQQTAQMNTIQSVVEPTYMMSTQPVNFQKQQPNANRQLQKNAYSLRSQRNLMTVS